MKKMTTMKKKEEREIKGKKCTAETTLEVMASKPNCRIKAGKKKERAEMGTWKWRE